MSLSKLSATLLIVLISLGCGSLPQSPQVYQCAFFYSEPEPAESEFLCVNNKDNNDYFWRPMSEMHGAQALDLDDYRAYSNYWDALKKRLIDAMEKFRVKATEVTFEQ